jgi:hypothetical protein
MFEHIDIVPDLVPRELCFDTINECELWLKEELGK